MDNMTIYRLIEIEPRIGTLLKDARRLRGRGTADTEYINLKRHLESFVWYGAARSQLQNEQAYQSALIALVDALGY
jgi:hypothetical protein